MAEAGVLWFLDGPPLTPPPPPLKIEVGDKIVKVSASFGGDIWEAINFGQVRRGALRGLWGRSGGGGGQCWQQKQEQPALPLASERRATACRPLVRRPDAPHHERPPCSFPTLSDLNQHASCAARPLSPTHAQVVYAIKTRNGDVYMKLKRNFGDMSALQASGRQLQPLLPPPLLLPQTLAPLPKCRRHRLCCLASSPERSVTFSLCPCRRRS